MSKFKVLLLVLVSSVVLNAGGMGVYVPYSLGLKVDGTSESDNGGSWDYDHDLKNKTGIGVAIATNLGKNQGFGYKLAFEVTHPEVDVTGAQESDKYDLINTFETGIVKTRFVRVWIGPRINIGYEKYETDSYERSGVEVGIAPAVGINLNLGNYLALTFDVDYKFAWQGGAYDNTSYYYSDEGSYSQTVSGLTARFGVFLKFNESFDVVSSGNTSTNKSNSSGYSNF